MYSYERVAVPLFYKCICFYSISYLLQYVKHTEDVRLFSYKYPGISTVQQNWLVCYQLQYLASLIFSLISWNKEISEQSWYKRKKKQYFQTTVEQINSANYPYIICFVSYTVQRHIFATLKLKVWAKFLGHIHLALRYKKTTHL